MARQPLEPTAPHPQQPQRDTDGPHLLRQVDVCRRLGISDQTWMNWRKAGRTPEAIVMPSGLLRWRVVDIARLEGTPVEPERGRQYFQAARRHRAATVTAFSAERPHKTHDRKELA
jgi:hypothetical protein